MAEDELIETVAAALWKQEAASVPGTHARRTPDAFQDQATEWREKWLGMARCALAVVRSHDAARVPADAELDGLVGALAEVRCEGLQETCWAASDAITALRARLEWSPSGDEQASWYARMSDEDRRVANKIMREGCAEHTRLTRALRDAEIASGITITALRRRVAEMEAERDKLRSEAEWHPRESAPRDGEEFIAGNPGFAPFSLRWRDGQFVHLDPDDGWIALPFELWRPLPSPPSDAQEGRADG